MAIVKNYLMIIGTVEGFTSKQLTKSTVYETVLLTEYNGKPTRVKVQSYKQPPPHGTECQAVGQISGKDWNDRILNTENVDYFTVPYHSNPQPPPPTPHVEAKVNGYAPQPPADPVPVQPELPKADVDEDIPF